LYGLKKRVDGVNCDVWIGKKLFEGVDTIFEWYFMSNFWNRTDIIDPTLKIPVQITITRKIPNTNVGNNFKKFLIEQSI